MRKLLLLILVIAPSFLMAQGANCADMDPICTDVGANFTANTGTTSEAGNDYGCLFTQPNPSWYYFEVATNGNIDMSLTAPSDIDFIIWGPFANLAAAQANCGSLGPGNEVDCSYSATNNETPSIPGAVAGEVYIMLITNYANVTQDITLTQTGGTGSTDCNIVNNPPCFMSYFEANIGICDAATDTYEVTGQIDFDDPPVSGDLIVVDCNGNQVIVASAPFTVNAAGEGSETYTLPGSDANGLPCDVTAYFTADPTCTMNITYTAPECLCFFDFFQITQNACDPGTGTFEVDGYVEFTSPPSSGTLTFTNSCTGATDVYFAPFTSPQTYSFPGMVPSGNTGCTVTAVFSAEPGCTMTSLPYDDPANCTCPVEIGTFTEVTTGAGTSQYDMCFGESFTVTPNGDWTPHDDLGGAVGIAYDPGIAMGIWDCPPSVNPPTDLNTDPCFLGIVSTNIAGGWTETNSWGDCATFWYAPISMYNWGAIVYGIVYSGDVCYDIGAAYPLTSLAPINAVPTEDCYTGTATATLSGGSPECNGSDFSIVPGSLVPANASFDNTTAPNNGTITISGLVDGDAYSYDVIDDAGCPITVSGTFTGLEDASFTYDFKYCQDDANPLPVITGVPGGNFSSAPAGLVLNGFTGLINLAASTPGIYTITYVSPAAICEGTATFVVTINPVPVVIATEDSPICDDGVSTIQLDEVGGEATEWLWTSSGGATFDFDTIQNPVVTGAVNGETFTVTAINILTGCQNTDNVSVTVIALDDPAFTTTDFCIGSANAANVTGTPGGTFAFNPLPGDGATINTTTGEISNEVAGTTYTIEYTTSGTCPMTSTQTVTVFDLPTVVTADVSVCLGGSVDITAGGAVTYSWAPGTWLSATTGATVTSTPLADIAYTITGTDANGCQNTAIANVTVAGNAPIDAGPDQIVCDGASVTLTAAGGVVYVWDNGVTDGVAFTPGVGTITYTVNGTDANGCSGTDQVDVTVNPLPVVNAGPDQTVCDGVAVTLSGSGATGYVWDNGVADGVAFTPGVGTVTYTVTGTDANGCVNTDQVDVTVNPLPVVDAGPDQTVCDGASVTLSGSGATGYVWDNGVTDGAAFTPAVGTITYTVTGTDANGCIDTDQVDVTVNPLPVVVAGPDQTVCDGIAVTLSGSGATGYVWNNGITDGVAFVQAVGTVTYTVTGTDANGCVNTDQVDVTVNPLPVVVAGPDQTVCEGVAVTLSGAGATGYVWDNGVTDGVAFTPAVGTITYTVTGTDANGCVNTDQVDVTVNPLPVVNAGPDQTVCDGVAVTLSGTGANAYAWDNGVADGVAFTPAVGTITYTVTGTDINGCIDTDQVDVTVNPLPVVDAGPDQTVCDGVAVTLNGAGATGYVWDNGVTDGVAFTPAIGTLTYTVTGTDANGCVNTDQVDVTVNPNPTPIINGATEYCTGFSTTLSTSVPFTTYLWSTSDVTPTTDVTIADNPITVTVTNAFGCSGTSAVFTVIENSVINYNSSITICQGEVAVIHGNNETVAGVYSQTYILPTGCDSVANVTLIVNPLPIVDAGIDQAVCDGVQTTITATGATAYVWDNGVTNGVPFTQAVGTTTYTVTGTDANGCVNTDQVDIVVNPLPVVDAGPDQTVCDGVAVTLSGAGATGYVWNNGVTDGVAFTPVVGTVTYTVTGTDANGCVNTDQVDVTVNPLPAVDAGPDQTVCDGVAVTLSGSGATGYIWDNGVTDGVAFTPAVGTITYTVTGTDANGCVNTDQVDVTVNPLPIVDAGPDQTVCDGVAVTLSGSGANVYAWDNGVADGIAFTPAVGTITYTVTGTDANGCVNTDQVDVTVNPLPVVDAGPDQTVCVGVAVTLSGSGATGYAWDNGVTDGVAFTPAVGTITYTVTGTDANGCVNTDQVDVTVNPLPAVDAGPDQTVCDGVAVTLSGLGATGYVWDNGVTDGVAFVQAVGTITYTVTGTDANGCVNTDQVDVTVNPLPVVDAGIDQTVCDGVAVTLNGAGAVGYVWDNGVTNGVAFTPAVGTITYTVTGTDANGCINTDQVDVTVTPIPVVDAGPDQSVCDGVAVTLNGSGATGYVWDNGVIDGAAFVQGVGTITYTVTGTDANGCSNTDQVDVTVTPLPVVFAGNDVDVCEGDQITLTATGAVGYVWDNGVTNGIAFNPVSGVYTVIGTDANGCIGTDDVLVTVEPLPVPSFIVDVPPCEPFTVTLTNTTPSAVNDCIWSINNGTVINGCGPIVYTFPSAGTYDVTLTTSSLLGCTASVTYDDIIYLEANPNASFNPGTSVISSFNTEIQFNNTSTGATSYVWEFGDETPSSSEVNPAHTFPDDGSATYLVTLVAYSPLGCTDTAYATVQVNEELIFYVPNTFTPDGDDFNQTFKPVFTSGYDPFDYVMYIYNRWGEVVFETHNVEVGWDATYAGRFAVQDGTFTWKIEVKTSQSDERIVIHGHVNVLR